MLFDYQNTKSMSCVLFQKDKESWMNLCEKISETTYIIGDVVYHRPGLLKDEDIVDDFKTSGVVLKLENVNTITDVMSATKKMTGALGFCLYASIVSAPYTTGAPMK